MGFTIINPYRFAVAAGGIPTHTALVEEEIAGSAGQQYESSSFTPSNKPMLIMVFARSSADVDVPMDSVTFGTAARGYGTGTAATELARSRNSRAQAYLYKIDAPGSTGGTVQVDFSADTAVRGVAVYEFDGASGFGAGVTTGTTTNSSTTKTVSVTTTADSSSVFFLGATPPANAQTLTGDQTLEYSLDTLYLDAVVNSAEAATIGTYSCTFTSSVSMQHACVAVEVLS